MRERVRHGHAMAEHGATPRGDQPAAELVAFVLTLLTQIASLGARHGG